MIVWPKSVENLNCVEKLSVDWIHASSFLNALEPWTAQTPRVVSVWVFYYFLWWLDTRQSNVCLFSNPILHNSPPKSVTGVWTWVKKNINKKNPISWPAFSMCWAREYFDNIKQRMKRRRGEESWRFAHLLPASSGHQLQWAKRRLPSLSPPPPLLRPLLSAFST